MNLLKLAKGVASPDEMAELLGALGVQCEMRRVTLQEAGQRLQFVQDPRTELFTLEMQMKDGQIVVGLLAIPPDPQAVKGKTPPLRALPEPA